MTSLLIALLLGSAPPLDVLARGAIAGATTPGAHAELLGIEGAPARCAAQRVEIARPITGSGRASLRLWGRDAAGSACEGWAWARVRVSAPTLVTHRAVAEGEPLAAAVAPVDREVQPGRAPIPSLPDGARAARALPSGTALEPGLIRVGPAPGEAVSVAVLLGTLRVEEVGRAVACRAGRACALLPSGRRVEGIWHDGRIVVESP